MRHKSKLKGRKLSWKERCLRIEWSWDRKGWSSHVVRQVYQLYQDWEESEKYPHRGRSVIDRFYGRGKGMLTVKIVYAMVGSYRNYLRAIGDIESVEQEDS